MGRGILDKDVATLLGSGVDSLRSSIVCARNNHRQIPIDTLRRARAAEASSAGARVTMLKVLDAEIKRQERLA